MKKKATNATINVRGTEITVIRQEDQDYISVRRWCTISKC